MGKVLNGRLLFGVTRTSIKRKMDLYHAVQIKDCLCRHYRLALPKESRSEVRFPRMSNPQPVQAKLTRTVCETIFNLWEQTSDWPSADTVLIKLQKLGHRFKDFEALEKAVQPGTIRKLERSWNDIRALLSPRGVHLCKNSNSITEVFAAGLRHAYDLFKSSPFGPATITKGDIRRLVGRNDEAFVTRISHVFLQDAIWIYRGSGLAGDEWSHRPGLGVIHYADVQTFDDFLAAEQRRLRKVSFAREHTNLLANVFGNWRRDCRWPNFLRFILDSEKPAITYRLLEELPKDFWQDAPLYGEESQTGIIRLWLEGIIASEAADQELTLLHRIVQVCCAHVLDHETEQRLTAQEIATQLHEDLDQVTAVGLLLEHRDYQLGMLVFPEGASWYCTPKRDILEYQHTKNFKELWAHRAKLIRAETKAGNTMQRVFYSWQSDLPTRTNRSFIEDALNRAIKKVNKESEIQIEPAPDRDTKGVPGSPNIIDAIFAKIRGCAVFVCDVSIINKGKVRPTPNPNVLFEAGYALAHKGWDKVICVVNTAYGPAESLPFDLRSRRVTPYKLPEGSDDKAGERQRLVDTLAEAITLAMQEHQEGMPA